MRFWITLVVVVAVVGTCVAGVIWLRHQRIAAQQAEAARQTPVEPEQQQPVPAEPVEDEAEDAAVSVEPPVDAEEASVDGEELALVRVYGTVTDAKSGVPIAGALVAAQDPFFERFREDEKEEPQDEAPASEVESDEDGAFSLEIQVRKRTGLACSAKGYARTEENLPRAAKGDVRIDFALEPGAGIAGVVTDLATGEGILDVQVTMSGTRETMFERMQRFSRGPSGLTATTAEDGSYVIEGLKPGSYKVAVQARSVGYIFRPQDTVTVKVEEASYQEDVNFKLERGAVVEGAVRAPDRQLVEGVNVVALPAQILDAALKGMEAITPDTFTGLDDSSDDEGRFRIIGLDYDTGYRLKGDVDGYAAANSPVFRIGRNDPTAQVDLTLSLGSLVSGRVRNADQTPAAECRVTLFPDIGAMFAGVINEPESVETDESGTFQFEHVSAGKYNLYAGPRPSPFAMAQTPQGMIIEIDGVNDVVGLELIKETTVAAKAKEEGKGVIDGVVFSASGEPVSGVRVEATRADNPMETSGAATGEDGGFQIAKLRGRSYNLLVNCDDGRGEQKGVSVGSKVTIRLDPPTTVSGVVVDAAGEPAAACKVSMKKQTAPEEKEDFAQTMATLMQGMLGGGMGGEQTDAYGFFEFKNVEAGAYVVKAESSSKGTGQSTPFTLVAGSERTGLRIVLEPGVEFGGVVTDNGGARVSGAQVSLLPGAEGDMMGMMSQFLPTGMQQTSGSATSDEDGEFLIAQVAPGAYTVSASHPDYAKSLARDVAVSSGRSVNNYTITMTEGGGAGGVYLVDGQPQAGAMAQLVGENGMHMVTTDENGRFDFANVTPGTYMLNTVDMSAITQGDFASAASAIPRIVEITDDQATEIDFAGGGGMPVGGMIGGESLGNMTTVILREPGGQGLEGLNSFDIEATIRATESMAGKAIVGPDGTFQMDDVEPGTYILEVYPLEIDMQNPDLNALMNMDYSPVISQEVVVGEGPVQLNLSVGAAANE